jgi:CHAT domain-containing protein
LESNPPLPFRKLIAFAYPKSDVIPDELIFAEREVRRIALEDPQTISLLDDHANEAVLDTIHLDNNAVHFACHGWGIPDDPLSVGVVLKEDAQHDGMWTAREISNKSLKCTFVFLNLCPPVESLENHNQRILTESFMEAGTTNVISPLWKVEDLAAAVTAKTFYRYLQEQTKDNNSVLTSDKEMDALRMAQLSVRDKVNSHPAYWAGYELLN